MTDYEREVEQASDICLGDGCADCAIGMGKYADSLCDPLKAENAKLREQMERLVTLLRIDYDIDASWDGLRHFWNIGLTKDGCMMRDRACKTEAENAKLRELVSLYHYGATHEASPSDVLAWSAKVDSLRRELGIEEEVAE